MYTRLCRLFSVTIYAFEFGRKVPVTAQTVHVGPSTQLTGNPTNQEL